MGYSGANKAEPICGVLLDRYDKVQKTFRSFVVKVPGRDGVEQDIPLCGPAWAAVVPNAGYSTFTKLRADVTQGRITRENILPGNMPAKKLLLTMGDGAGQGGEDKGEMEFRLLKSYVRELASTLEHAPVPGGARELEYVVPRETWEQRALQCEKHFSANGHEMVVDRRKLKEAWMAMASFVDKAMKSHSKCDDCAYHDAQWASVIGDTTQHGINTRTILRSAKVCHRALMGTERGELDDAGYRGIVYPPIQLILMADGATQSNYMLPRIRERLPKELARTTLFNCKLYGVYIYGYGMTCYVIHESVGGGANLCCTAIFLAVSDAIAAGRPLPEEMHFQLDNTVGENKCITVFCFAAWIVQRKWAKRVRIFFLTKGHTHVLIDQCFGSITKVIRGRSVLTLDALLESIKETIDRSKKYMGKNVQRLHHLFDFKSFFEKAHTNLGGFATGAFNKDGYHDFHITLNEDGDAILNLKKYGSTPDFVEEANGGFRIFKDGAFDALPQAPAKADIKGDDAWSPEEFSSTYRRFEQYFHQDAAALAKIRESWERTMKNTAAATSALLPENICAFPTITQQRQIAEVHRGGREPPARV